MKQQVTRYITQFFDFFARKMATIKASALYSEINDYYIFCHGFFRFGKQFYC